MKPIVQISLDFQSLDDALHTADIAVRAGVDWLEVGTPLILGAGAVAVDALHKRYPNHPIVADIKCMDAGYLEAEQMFRAGASHVVVMALAHPSTVAGAVRAAKTYNRSVMADIMLCSDKPAAARQMQELGVDIVIVHTGFDERHAEVGKTPFDDLDAVRAAVDLPLQAVGGISLEQAPLLPAKGASIVVIGAPLAVSDHSFTTGASDEQLFNIIQDFVSRVKSGGRSAT